MTGFQGRLFNSFGIFMIKHGKSEHCVVRWSGPHYCCPHFIGKQSNCYLFSPSMLTEILFMCHMQKVILCTDRLAEPSPSADPSGLLPAGRVGEGNGPSPSHIPHRSKLRLHIRGGSLHHFGAVWAQQRRGQPQHPHNQYPARIPLLRAPGSDCVRLEHRIDTQELLLQ